MQKVEEAHPQKSSEGDGDPELPVDRCAHAKSISGIYQILLEEGEQHQGRRTQPYSRSSECDGVCGELSSRMDRHPGLQQTLLPTRLVGFFITNRRVVGLRLRRYDSPAERRGV